ncbi:twin-arginine translocase TatA/TatE family subunit [Hymenobacter sp. PAMC 26628]|uniref:twin-arginine translocase TatA/TatE family subunit n=1 Tax=Hymenobacter sp. PAMC 26628 TaxID=1484118 RepID=UPI0009E8429A
MQQSLLFLGDIGGSELILIMVVILVFFGANKIPELARGLGKGIREFKDASSEIRNEFERAGQQPQQPYNPNPNYNPNPGYNPNYPAQPGAPHDPYAAQPTPGYEPHPVAGAPTEQPYVAPVLPPNLAPEGTQPRQPYSPPSV